MEATTMRASTVIRSIPTRETRTQASMTIPLSRTRSRTSMRLVPPGARSTGMIPSSPLGGLRPLDPWEESSGLATGGERGHLALEEADLLAQLDLVLRLALAGREVPVVLPPIESDLARLVERADDEPDPDGEELDLRQRHLDVAGDDQ